MSPVHVEDTDSCPPATGVGHTAPRLWPGPGASTSFRHRTWGPREPRWSATTPFRAPWSLRPRFGAPPHAVFRQVGPREVMRARKSQSGQRWRVGRVLHKGLRSDRLTSADVTIRRHPLALRTQAELQFGHRQHRVRIRLQSVSKKRALIGAVTATRRVRGPVAPRASPARGAGSQLQRDVL